MQIVNFSKITLGELLSSDDEIIKNNAISILKRLQRAKAHKPVINYENLDRGESSNLGKQ